MEQFTTLTAGAVPLMRINIDTDQIIPTRFLLRTSEEGLGEGLFADWRFTPEGVEDPHFILNQEPYRHAQIVLADRNFGCGSSRESAPRALRQFGFRCVLAPSFGDIFYSNCFRNGLLPVRIAIEIVEQIAAAVNSSSGALQLSVDLQHGLVNVPDLGQFPFDTPAGLQSMLLLGEDEIDQTQKRAVEIERFRSHDRIRRPWAYRPG